MRPWGATNAPPSSIALYEIAAAVLSRVDEGAGVRTTLYQQQMPNAFRPTVLALVSETIKHKQGVVGCSAVRGGYY